MSATIFHILIHKQWQTGFDAMMDHSEKKSLGIFYTAVSGKHRLSEDFGKLRSAFGSYIKVKRIGSRKRDGDDANNWHVTISDEAQS